MKRGSNGHGQHSVIRSVVKVLTVSDAPDYDQPWQTKGATSASGSGVIVMTRRGPRVLTNAHVVENHVYIQVRRYGKSRKYSAVVEGIGHVCDLALLQVEDRGFYAGVTPMPLGDLPLLTDRVSVLGYPIGGDRLSITEGIVSRIELSTYEQSQRNLLAVQIDAAVNAGNSGGPVVRNGKLVGIAFQGYDEGENIGYMIGAPVIQHFLTDMERHECDGFPDLGVVWQPLEGEAHRHLLGLPHEGYGGVLVSGVAYDGSAFGVLERGDVLLEIDGVRIAADGSVPFRNGERIDFAYVIAQHHVGDDLTAKIWRNGRLLERRVTLGPPRPLVPEDRYDVKPTYYLYGGLLFVPLTRDYLKTWGPDWRHSAPGNLVTLYETGIRTPTRRGIVVLQKVLADRANQGYHELESVVITSVQGRPIADLPDLLEQVETTDSRFIRFDADDGKQFVLDRELVKRRHKAIMRRFGVPADRSDDLRQKAQSHRARRRPGLARARPASLAVAEN